MANLYHTIAGKNVQITFFIYLFINLCLFVCLLFYLVAEMG